MLAPGCFVPYLWEGNLTNIASTDSTWSGCDRIRGKRDEQVAQLTQDVRAMDLDLQKVERITGLCMAELIDKLKSGELSAVDVLHAYQKVALDAHEKTNCLTVVFSEAEEWARSLDQGASRDGLLYGVPISIKSGRGLWIKVLAVMVYCTGCRSASRVGEVSGSRC